MAKVGFVYLLGDLEKEGIYKIGVTTGKIENRIKKLQTGNSGEIYIVDYFKSKNPFFVEKWMHKQFLSNRLNGEWFNLQLDNVKTFKSTCEKFEKLYETINKNNDIKNKLKYE